MLFKGKDLTTAFDSKGRVIDLNNVKIEAFPSHHLDAMRGLPNVSFILLDEADSFFQLICSFSESFSKDFLDLIIID
jgi:hypothetical protein